MGKMENSDDGSTAAEDDDELPPSPTLSNSPPPSMVAPLKPEINEADYRRMLMQWHSRNQSESRYFEQTNSNNCHSDVSNKNAAMPASQLHSLMLDRSRGGRHSPTSSYDLWRTEAEESHSSTNRSPSSKLIDSTHYPFGVSSAAVAAAFAISAASMSEEERTKRIAATAAFWDGFRQAAASIHLPEKPDDKKNAKTTGLFLLRNVSDVFSGVVGPKLAVVSCKNFSKRKLCKLKLIKS